MSHNPTETTSKALFDHAYLKHLEYVCRLRIHESQEESIRQDMRNMGTYLDHIRDVSMPSYDPFSWQTCALEHAKGPARHFSGSYWMRSLPYMHQGFVRYQSGSDAHTNVDVDKH